MDNHKTTSATSNANRRDPARTTDRISERLLEQQARERARDARNRANGSSGSNGQPGAEGGAEGAAVPRDRAKYLLLEVPNFNDAEDEESQMTSYLRLGTVPEPEIAANPYAPKATGEDLAAYVTSFLDDDRKRDGCPGFVSEEDRKAETSILHTKGGWRDHSDGNRITTTRGDKVEVIRGNYTMLVLGRQDAPHGGAGWDVSGGHIEGAGGRSSIEWVQTFDGTWKTVETSEKGDTDVTQHGNSVSRNYGEILDSSTGSEDEKRPSWDAEGKPIWVHAPNPVITDRTWARRIESYTGSARRRVPVMRNETWADELASVTDVETLSDETRVSGSMSSTTIAETMTDTTIAAAITSVTLANTTSLTVGNTAQVTVGATENVTVGAVLDFTLAAMLQMCVGATLSVNIGPRAEYNLGSAMDLSPAKEEVTGAATRVVGTEVINAMLYSVKAATIYLG